VHQAKDVDLDITLNRGLIVLTNTKKEGEAKVRLRLWGETWLLHLHDPQTRVGLELHGRLPPGIPKDLRKLEPPVAEVMGLIGRGQAFLDLGVKGVGLREPPGPAMFHWDSLSRQLGLRRVARLSDVLTHPLDDPEDKVFKEICSSTANLGVKGLAAWLKERAQGEAQIPRLAAMTLAGAVDDLYRVQEVLATSKNAETREHAILVLRHWLGREPGQAERLFAKLTKEKHLSEVQARSVLQLLIGFDQDDRGRPETYEMLIEYLRHSKQPVRALAHWHLVRLVPEGREIAYDPSGSEAERTRGFERWQALIPPGQLPPPLAKQPK
jgi:hypothetical protein